MPIRAPITANVEAAVEAEEPDAGTAVERHIGADVEFQNACAVGIGGVARMRTPLM